MNTQLSEMTRYNSSESYQMIKDEHLAFTVVSSQILAGSRILLSTYKQVVFSDCSFYACEFQGVTFEDCVFENCNFEFSHIRKCKFINCSFHNCTWKASSSFNSLFQDCDLDQTLTEMTFERGNQASYSKDSHTTDIYIELLTA